LDSALGGSVARDDDFTLCGYFAVKLEGIEDDFDGEGLTVIFELNIVRYSPRVPACAVSAEGHDAFGGHSAVTACDYDPGVK